jgi:hypothetical protein
MLVSFDLASLSTHGLIKFPNSIVGFGGAELLSTAHPTLRKSDGYLYNYLLETKLLPFSGPNVAHIFKTDKNLRRTLVGSVAMDRHGFTPYVHDISLTDHYAIL